jgi:hypothetical protein
MVVVTVIGSAYALKQLFKGDEDRVFSIVQFNEKILDATMRYYVLSDLTEWVMHLTKIRMVLLNFCP